MLGLLIAAHPSHAGDTLYTFSENLDLLDWADPLIDGECIFQDVDLCNAIGDDIHFSVCPDLANAPGLDSDTLWGHPTDETPTFAIDTNNLFFYDIIDDEFVTVTQVTEISFDIAWANSEGSPESPPALENLEVLLFDLDGNVAVVDFTLDQEFDHDLGGSGKGRAAHLTVTAADYELPNIAFLELDFSAVLGNDAKFALDNLCFTIGDVGGGGEDCPLIPAEDDREPAFDYFTNTLRNTGIFTFQQHVLNQGLDPTTFDITWDSPHPEFVDPDPDSRTDVSINPDELLLVAGEQQFDTSHPSGFYSGLFTITDHNNPETPKEVLVDFALYDDLNLLLSPPVSNFDLSLPSPTRDINVSNPPRNNHEGALQASLEILGVQANGSIFDLTGIAPGDLVNPGDETTITLQADHTGAHAGTHTGSVRVKAKRTTEDGFLNSAIEFPDWVWNLVATVETKSSATGNVKKDEEIKKKKIGISGNIFGATIIYGVSPEDQDVGLGFNSDPPGGIGGFTPDSFFDIFFDSSAPEAFVVQIDVAPDSRAEDLVLQRFDPVSSIWSSPPVSDEMILTSFAAFLEAVGPEIGPTHDGVCGIDTENNQIWSVQSRDGTYRVVERSRLGPHFSTEEGESLNSLTIPVIADSGNVDIPIFVRNGGQTPATISLGLFPDVEGAGLRGPDPSPLAGVSIRLQADLQINTGLLPNGNHTRTIDLTETTQPDHSLDTLPVHIQVHDLPEIGFIPNPGIAGVLFADEDGDGVRGTVEPGLAGALVALRRVDDVLLSSDVISFEGTLPGTLITPDTPFDGRVFSNADRAGVPSGDYDELLTLLHSFETEDELPIWIDPNFSDVSWPVAVTVPVKDSATDSVTKDENLGKAPLSISRAHSGVRVAGGHSNHDQDVTLRYNDNPEGEGNELLIGSAFDLEFSETAPVYVLEITTTPEANALHLQVETLDKVSKQWGIVRRNKAPHFIGSVEDFRHTFQGNGIFEPIHVGTTGFDPQRNSIWIILDHDGTFRVRRLPPIFGLTDRNGTPLGDRNRHVIRSSGLLSLEVFGRNEGDVAATADLTIDPDINEIANSPVGNPVIAPGESGLLTSFLFNSSVEAGQYSETLSLVDLSDPTAPPSSSTLSFFVYEPPEFTTTPQGQITIDTFDTVLSVESENGVARPNATVNDSPSLSNPLFSLQPASNNTTLVPNGRLDFLVKFDPPSAPSGTHHATVTVTSEMTIADDEFLIGALPIAPWTWNLTATVPEVPFVLTPVKKGDDLGKKNIKVSNPAVGVIVSKGTAAGDQSISLGFNSSPPGRGGDFRPVADSFFDLGYPDTPSITVVESTYAEGALPPGTSEEDLHFFQFDLGTDEFQVIGGPAKANPFIGSFEEYLSTLGGGVLDENDLHKQGVDPETNTVWAVVNESGTYAIGLVATPALAPQLLGIAYDSESNTATLTYRSEDGIAFGVEGSGNLTEFETLPETEAGNGTIMTYEHQPAGDPDRYWYRLVRKN